MMTEKEVQDSLRRIDNAFDRILRVVADKEPFDREYLADFVKRERAVVYSITVEIVRKLAT